MAREHLTMGTKARPGIYRCNDWAREHGQREEEGEPLQSIARGGFSGRPLLLAKRVEQ
jgi:hypothetical protein